jgi:hypothetical protein
MNLSLTAIERGTDVFQSLLTNTWQKNHPQKSMNTAPDLGMIPHWFYLTNLSD